MDTQPTKRRGPMTILLAHPRLLQIGIWAVVVYALSSGPARTVACRRCQGTLASGGQIQVVDDGWWPQVYGPIGWAQRQPWGGPVRMYLQLFPIVRHGPPVLLFAAQ
jgi:hypothetical protein